jgi:hypothetical protein
MADDQSQYNSSHRAFLQAFLARSVLTLEDAKPILAAIITAHGESNTIRIALRAIHILIDGESGGIFFPKMLQKPISMHT